jgi:hypothetical protein
MRISVDCNSMFWFAGLIWWLLSGISDPFFGSSHLNFWAAWGSETAIMTTKGFIN